MNNYSNILINVNGSLEPLREGLCLAAQNDSWATVLKVTPPYEGDINLTGVGNIHDVIGSDRRETVMALRDAVRETNGRAWVRVADGDIAETISRIAQEEGCDLIVMGSGRDEGFLRRLITVRLIRQIKDLAPCPVHVVDCGRQPEHAIRANEIPGDIATVASTAS